MNAGKTDVDALPCQAELPERVDVTFSRLVDIVAEQWHLARWAFATGHERERAVARQAARELSAFLRTVGFDIADLAGQPYDPGLAVDVIDSNEGRDREGRTAVIKETITPIILWRGRVVRAGQVLIGAAESDR